VYRKVPDGARIRGRYQSTESVRGISPVMLKQCPGLHQNVYLGRTTGSQCMDAELMVKTGEDASRDGGLAQSLYAAFTSVPNTAKSNSG
jgi:hypothetical protein